MTVNKLTHFDDHGQAHMVDVGHKQETRRRAVAQGTIHMSGEAFEAVRSGSSSKGDVLGIARIAAIQGSKQTASLIPLCHPLPLTKVRVNFMLNASKQSITIQVQAETTSRTGVEMEALCAVNIGLLTVYDMLKAVDKNMRLTDIELVEKSGGKSGDWKQDYTLLQADVLCD